MQTVLLLGETELEDVLQENMQRTSTADEYLSHTVGLELVQSKGPEIHSLLASGPWYSFTPQIRIYQVWSYHLLNVDIICATSKILFIFLFILIEKCNHSIT